MQYKAFLQVNTPLQWETCASFCKTCLYNKPSNSVYHITTCQGLCTQLLNISSERKQNIKSRLICQKVQFSNTKHWATPGHQANLMNTQHGPSLLSFTDVKVGVKDGWETTIVFLDQRMEEGSNNRLSGLMLFTRNTVLSTITLHLPQRSFSHCTQPWPNWNWRLEWLRVRL